MMLNNWLQQKQDAAKAAAADPAEQPATPASRTVELTTQEIAALSLFLGEDTESGFCLSKIATDEVSEEALATDGKQCLILHVPELNADSELYAIPVPGLSAERGEKFPNVREVSELPRKKLFEVDLQRLEQVVQALRLITRVDVFDRQNVSVYRGEKSGPLFFTGRTDRGQATAMLSTYEDEENT